MAINVSGKGNQGKFSMFSNNTVLRVRVLFGKGDRVGLEGFGLCCLMAAGLSKDIPCHV